MKAFFCAHSALSGGGIICHQKMTESANHHMRQP
jgi:hypothetical protein